MSQFKTKEEETKKKTAEAKRKRPPKLVTTRDKHLVALVATARYLSTEQVCRVVFPGREKRTAEGVLEALAGIGREAVKKPLLRRLLYRPFDGAPVMVWAPSIDGYQLTEDTFSLGIREPRQDIGQGFLEHTVQLNQLLVALLEPDTSPAGRRHGRRPQGPFARADFRHFRWLSSESTRLPWKPKDPKAGIHRDRVIQPDALLELPKTRRRLFLECEMGTHTIQPVSPDKPNATLTKAGRYAEYLTGRPVGGGSTFYEMQYSDGFTPEVLFLVLTATRAAHVGKALQEWSAQARRPLAARALTFEVAAAELTQEVGGARPRRESVAPSAPAEVAEALAAPETPLLAAFCAEAIQRLQWARHQIRALPSDARQKLKLTEPPYPANAQQVQALVARLQRSV